MSQSAKYRGDIFFFFEVHTILDTPLDKTNNCIHLFIIGYDHIYNTEDYGTFPNHIILQKSLAQNWNNLKFRIQVVFFLFPPVHLMFCAKKRMMIPDQKYWMPIQKHAPFCMSLCEIPMQTSFTRSLFVIFKHCYVKGVIANEKKMTKCLRHRTVSCTLAQGKTCKSLLKT